MSDIPESARLSDEQIDAVTLEFIEEMEISGQDPPYDLTKRHVRAAEDHAYHSRDAEVERLNGLIDYINEEKGQLQELSEMWHVEVIAVKREACQIKEQLNKARDDIAGLLGNAEDIEYLKLERNAARAQVAALVAAWEWVKNDARYKAPEQLPDRWILNRWFGRMDAAIAVMETP